MPKSQIKASSPAFMDRAASTWVLVSEIYWMSYKLLERRLYELDVSASQSRVIVTLYLANEPMKPSTIATVLFQETQSITGILHRIEGRGWVIRTPDPNDRRAVGLALTPEGRKVAERIAAISDELYDELFKTTLTATEQRQVDALLKRVRARGFTLPETDFRLRRARLFPIWSD